MRRRIVALAVAALVVAGCDGAFNCQDKGGGRSGPNQEQPSGESGAFGDG